MAWLRRQGTTRVGGNDMGGAGPAAHEPVSAVINAPRAEVYRAFTEPEALQAWLAPAEMTARIRGFDLRAGGGYLMTLTYPPATPGSPGKSSAREDRYSARFEVLDPGARIVQTIQFDTDDPAFAGKMTMTVELS